MGTDLASWNDIMMASYEQRQGEFGVLGGFVPWWIKYTSTTGGKHADEFVSLIAAIVRDAGLPNIAIHTVRKTERTLPGYYRPTKEWDVVVLSDNDLVAVVEVKSQVGSFGNNFNNRVEEALGNATDFWAAYSKGAFKPSAQPWLGYLFMLEENPASTRPTRRISLSPYSVDEAFQQLSYARRYEEVCQRLVRERLYDASRESRRRNNTRPHRADGR